MTIIHRLNRGHGNNRLPVDYGRDSGLQFAVYGLSFAVRDFFLPFGEAGVAVKVVATNKKARHDYFVEDTYEAGMVLRGSEVKALRAGKINLRDSYARVKRGEVFVYNMHISPYSHATYDRPDPLRVRKLLLKKREIRKLVGMVSEKGFALVPLRVYFNERGKAKMELGVCKGKKLYDKRASLKQRDAQRDLERAMRDY
jgi:SsrA-binding protein